MTEQDIVRNTGDILRGIPAGITVVAAAKNQPPRAVRAVAAGGARHIGYNYVQEAARMKEQLAGLPVTWRLIGHLQRNKIKQALQVFDTVDTVDSLELAAGLEAHLARDGRLLPVLIEVNSGQEPNKSGVLPAEVLPLAGQICLLPHLRLRGLMTMGPFVGGPGALRAAFNLTAALFQQLAAAKLENADIVELSMGMSDSYPMAIEEGATMVRIGTLLFGARD